MKRFCITFVFQIAFMMDLLNSVAAQQPPYMRIAKIVVDSASLNDYVKALKEGMSAAVRNEPGVLHLYAVHDKKQPTHITVFETYASVAAYEAHIKTAHFLKYKRVVEKMVRSLELVDVDPIALESK